MEHGGTVGVDHEERLRLVVEAAPNAMIMVNDRGRIVLVNSEAERSFGYARDELLELGIEDLIPDRFRRAHAGYREGFFAAPHRRGMGVGRELFGLRKDRTEMPIEIGLNPMVVGGEHFVLASVIEITERLRGQEAEAARMHDALRRTILDAIPFSVIATDASGRIVSVNPGAEELLGYHPGELVGARFTRIDAEPRITAENGSPVAPEAEVERTYRRKDGRLVPVNEAVVELSGDGLGSAGYLIVSYDITKRLEARARVQYLATHDTLTNLPNRELLMRHLDAAIAQAAATGTEVALLLLDLDHFKRVNDSLGHHIGDELLLQVSERLLGWTRRSDLVARLGGDEFVVVFSDLASAVDVDERIQELQGVLGRIDVQGYELVVTASTGAAVYPHDGATPAALLKHADIAMYKAKAAGRNNSQWFKVDMLGDADEKLSLSGALRQALGTDELTMVYQPQVDLASGEVRGFEALVRWTSPALGAVSPDRFIPVAEDGGMIRELGAWVLRTACADIAALQEEYGHPLRLAVNVSPRQLRGAAWIDEVVDALHDAGLDPHQLEVEITEGLLIEDHGDAITLLERIRALGVTIVIDDFGCGYSSLAYLARFPIDKIKIDRSFIQQISDVDTDAAIVDAIIVMAHALGLAVVAEGVETEVQREYLQRRGCDEVQGYLYAPGVPRQRALSCVRR